MTGLDLIKNTALELKKENIKGANYVVMHALSNLIKAVQKFKEKDLISNVDASCLLLFNAQPTMAPLTNCMALILNALERISQKSSNPEQMRALLISEIKQLLTDFQSCIEKIGHNASTIIQRRARILTYSFSSTVFETIKFQKKLGKDLSIFITEARPNNEGLIGAQEFSKIYPTTLFIDAGIGKILHEHLVNLVLIGADSITPSYLIHKIGTLPLAITAHELKVPIYALTHSLKYYYSDALNIIPPIEHKPAHEITTSKLENVKIKNYYFDRTPLKYLTGIITEKGIYDLKADRFTADVNFPIKALKRLYRSIHHKRD